MKCSTHLAAGAAMSGAAICIATAITDEVSMFGNAELLIVGMAAGTLPDVDLDGSTGRKVNLVMLIAMGGVSIGAQIYRWMNRMPGILTVLAAICAIIYVAMYMVGAFACEHRQATHSIPYGLVLSVLVLAITTRPLAAVVFLLAFLSHVGLDLLNGMPVRVLYPLHVSFCLDFCKGEGLADKLFLVGFIVVNIVEFVWLLFS